MFQKLPNGLLPPWDRIRAAVKSDVDGLVAIYLPNAVFEGKEWHLGDSSGQAGMSLGIRSDGIWIDRAGGGGGDLIDLIVSATGRDNSEIGRELARRYFMDTPAKPKAKATNEQESADDAGLTLSRYAFEKRLPGPFLRDLGCVEGEHYGKPCVVLMANGRKRLRMLDSADKKRKRFHHPFGAPLELYMPRPVAGSVVVLTEGESNTQTLLAAGIHAIGIPGAAAVKGLSDKLAAAVAGCSEILATHDRDEAADKMMEALRLTSIANKIRVVRDLPGKDVSELWIATGGNRDAFMPAWRAAAANAGPLVEPEDESDQDALKVISAADLVSSHPAYRPIIIDGLLREGETMNVIASPKVGKSWLVLLMAFSIANGWAFLNRACAKGSVLIVDNELHPETTAQRLRAVANALGAALNNIHVISLRGRLMDLPTLRPHLETAAKQIGAKVVILDALYRLIPEKTGENDNTGMMQMYNTLDGIASTTGAAIVNIHHASKGSQAEKSVTDGGAGAGAISRAADTHLILREHETPGYVVVDAVARSFPPPGPVVIAKQGDVWELVDGADPAKLKGRKTSRGATIDVAPNDVLAHVPGSPVPIGTIGLRLELAGINIGSDRLRGMLAVLVQAGSVVMEATPGRVTLYGTHPSESPTIGQHEAAVAYLRGHPEATVEEVMAATGCGNGTAKRARAAIKNEQRNRQGQPPGQVQGQPPGQGGLDGPTPPPVAPIRDTGGLDHGPLRRDRLRASPSPSEDVFR